MLKTIWRYLFQRDKIKQPRELSIKTLKYFIQGHTREIASKFGITEQWILERYNVRESQVGEKSPACLKTGSCINCGCSMKELLLSDAGCEHGCFPEIPGPMSWEQYKEVNKIDFNDSNTKSE